MNEGKKHTTNKHNLMDCIHCSTVQLCTVHMWDVSVWVPYVIALVFLCFCSFVVIFDSVWKILRGEMCDLLELKRWKFTRRQIDIYIIRKSQSNIYAAVKKAIRFSFCYSVFISLSVVGYRLWLNASSMYYCASHEAQFTTSWIHSAAMTGCHCYWDGTISTLKSYL